VPVFDYFISYHGDTENKKKIYGVLHELVTSIDYNFSMSKDEDIPDNLLPVKPFARTESLFSQF